MYPSCGIGFWLLYNGREGWLRNSELFGFKGSCSEDWLLKLPSNTASRLQDIVPTVVEACCTLDFLSSGLWGSSLGRFFGFAPGCLAWYFSSEVTAPQATTNKGNMPVSVQSNQSFQLMGTKYNACYITVRSVSLTVGLAACQKLVRSQNCCYKGSNNNRWTNHFELCKKTMSHSLVNLKILVSNVSMLTYLFE